MDQRTTPPALALVRDGVKTPLGRAKQAALDARVLADEVASNLLVDLKNLRARCLEVADLDALHPGTKDAILKMGAELGVRLNTIDAIRGRK